MAVNYQSDGVDLSSIFMPLVATGPSGNVLTSTGTVWTSAAPSGGGSSLTFLPTQTWANRGVLRSIDGPATALVIVEGLGLFIWTAGSNEPDDDETAFASPSGVWTMEVSSYDNIYSLMTAEFSNIGASFTQTASILNSGGTTISYTVLIPGATPGDTVLITANGAIRVIVSGYVSSSNFVTVTLCNAGTGNQNLPVGTWQILVIKQPSGVTA